MQSIRRKLILLILSAVLICTAVSAGFGLWTISRLQRQSSEQILTLTCQQQAGKLNQSLINIEGSVEACGELVTSKLGARRPRRRDL
ncbi:MAG: hypothetical protein IJ203_05130 [Atopobiaceae bacterium]|nr:hypothetical protein [Atopobiaceae bacterium]